MTAGVYKITNTKNNKCYIGSSKNIEKRWYFHKYDLIHGYHTSDKLQEDFVNHDLKDYIFEIIEEYPNYTEGDKNNLRAREQYYLDIYRNKGLLLNINIKANGWNRCITKEESKIYTSKRDGWRKQLENKYKYEYSPKERKEVFVYDNNLTLINHFYTINDCSRWLLDNNIAKSKSKNPVTSISGGIRNSINKEKPYCGFIFSYEPIKQELETLKM